MLTLKKRFYLLAVVYLSVMSYVFANVPSFFVEGATGAGKTTFVQLLNKELPNISVVYEPIETFTNVNGAGNILELFFSDQGRWAFTIMNP